MSDYWPIIYFDPQRPSGIRALPAEFKNILDWTWNQSVIVRWAIGDLDNPLALLTNDTQLLIFHWRVGSGNQLTKGLKEVRAARPTVPLLLVVFDGIHSATWKKTLDNDSWTQVVRLGDLGSANVPAIFEKLGISLPLTQGPTLHFARGDSSAKELVRLLGSEKRLALVIAKFFPNARIAEVRSISDDWSGSMLCLVYINGGDEPYFFRFFKRRDEYENELIKHQEAQKWLDDNLLHLYLIGGLGGDVSNQTEAFPETASGEIRGVVCYESASPRSCPRCTLKDVYRDHDEAHVTQGIQTCLQILACRQTNACVTESPWREDRFVLDNKAKATILATMRDLDPYGPAMCTDWKQCCDKVGQLVHGRLPDWLVEPRPVVIGHTHGDPNPRNCLVLPSDCTNFRFIDIGGYSSNGRLASDLAIVERDIKLVLMGIEKLASQYHDLDITDMCNWYYAERDAICRGIKYEPTHAPAAGPLHSPCHQAYKLVGLVRQRAKQVCGTGDCEGKHYFAALLFWTLEILKYAAVRPTKKLLAICSAAEILQRF